MPANDYPGGAPTRATWWADARDELAHSLTQVRAIEYFDSDTNFDWRYDAPGKAPGDSGADALSAVRAVAQSCYLDVLSRTCAHPAPHPKKSRKTKPPSATPTARVSPTPSPRSSPHLSAAPTSGPSPLGVAAIAGVAFLAVLGGVLTYRRFGRR